MKRVLIVAAPFGFGPSSIALTLAQSLRSRYEVTITTMETAAGFVAGNAPPGVSVAPGPFRQLFPSAAALAQFHAFVSINQVPALLHLASLGLAGRTVFFDNIAAWRSEAEPVQLPGGLLKRLVQDELCDAQASPARTQPGVVVTAPLMWPDGEVLPSAQRQGVLVHTGGLLSPAIGLAIGRQVVARLVAPVVDAMAARGEAVSLMGHAEVFGDMKLPPGAQVLPSVSPAAALQAIGRARLLVTTPGMGAVYEAMYKRTPIVLLPPVNSTQLQHYPMLTAAGLFGVMGERTRDELVRLLAPVPWQRQARALLELLLRHAGALSRRSCASVDQLLGADGEGRRQALVDRADALRARLSGVDAAQEVLQAIDHLAPRSHG